MEKEEEWNDFSISSVMQSMEDEKSAYSLKNISGNWAK